MSNAILNGSKKQLIGSFVGATTAGAVIGAIAHPSDPLLSATTCGIMSLGVSAIFASVAAAWESYSSPENTDQPNTPEL